VKNVNFTSGRRPCCQKRHLLKLTDNEHSRRHRSKNAPVNLARLRVTKVRRFQEPRTADFGKSNDPLALGFSLNFTMRVGLSVGLAVDP
jgi:hypothetical protein